LNTPSRFKRFILPGLAFKAIVIGGGYATGRELAEFFMPSGPRGGLLAMAVAMLIWSGVCAVTFAFARQTGSHDYRTFYRALLGRGWPIFEIAYFCSIILILSVFGAAAGAICEQTFGLPAALGMFSFTAGIVLFATFGNDAVEQLFKYVSFILYATYAVFLVLAVSKFGDRIVASFHLAVPASGWIEGGLSYTGYNIVGATLILPLIRHFTSAKDAVIAGLLCGPLAMIPAILFFVCMTAFYPDIARETIPSDYLLSRLDLPIFRVLFQIMIFAALLESGTGFVHAINERIAHSLKRGPAAWGRGARFWFSAALSGACVVLAARFGMVALIARGYRVVSWIFIGIYLVPLLSYGLWRVTFGHPGTGGNRSNSGAY
jgi:uncharacterized membrane protein YkvI